MLPAEVLPGKGRLTGRGVGGPYNIGGNAERISRIGAYRRSDRLNAETAVHVVIKIVKVH